MYAYTHWNTESDERTTENQIEKENKIDFIYYFDRMIECTEPAKVYAVHSSMCLVMLHFPLNAHVE